MGVEKDMDMFLDFDLFEVGGENSERQRHGNSEL